MEATRTYSTGSAVFITLNDRTGQDRVAKIQREHSAHLESVLKIYGFQVSRIDEIDLGLVPSMPNPTSHLAAKWFQAWLKREKASQGEGNKLLVVCYSGHGYQHESTSWHEEHLLASTRDRSYRFDLTRLQGIARRETDLDILFIMDCCCGSWPGLLERPDDDSHIQEILAGALSNTRATGSERDFGSRLWENLFYDRGPRSVAERAAAMHACAKEAEQVNYHAPIEYRFDRGRGRSIVLQPLSGNTWTDDEIEVEQSEYDSDVGSDESEVGSGESVLEE